ncbi:MAG: trigger factor [Acidimicrobiia bacterium]|nr:trigger factor [Acidimicrobiia bacterium]
MKSTVEPLEGNKVKVSIEVGESEFDKEVDAAFKRIAHEVRIPGFRPGKAPRRILEARVGVEAARADALQHALPEYYAQAVTEHEVDVIAAPEIDITSGETEGDVAFDAVVEIRPQITVGGYATLRVTIDSPEVTDEEIDHRIDHLREQFAEYVTVSREAREGDQVTIDIAGSQDGEQMSGLTADDYHYIVGSGNVVPELDEELTGSKVGDILQFTADHPQPDEDPVDFRVLVKDVAEQRLPDADDAWAEEASEFSTIQELRDDTRKRMEMVKKVQAQMAIQEKTGEALAELVDEEIPEPLVDAEVQNRIQDLAMRLQAQGMDLGQYLAATGNDQEAFVAELRDTATQAVKVDLALRAVAEAEGTEVTDEDLEEEFASIAERVGQKPEQVRKQFERNEQVPLVRSDIRKRKALEWLLEQVEVVDESGNPVDRAALTIEPETSEEADAEGDQADEAPSEAPEEEDE